MNHFSSTVYKANKILAIQVFLRVLPVCLSQVKYLSWRWFLLPYGNYLDKILAIQSFSTVSAHPS